MAKRRRDEVAGAARWSTVVFSLFSFFFKSTRQPVLCTVIPVPVFVYTHFACHLRPDDYTHVRNDGKPCSLSWLPAKTRHELLEGGNIAGWRTADYLFSADATSPDTLRIFESKDYLWNRVVVFHSLFLSACERRHSVKSVCIGHYVLPPASVQDEMRNVVGRLIWECEDEQSLAQASHKSFSCQTEDEHSEGEFSRSNSDTESEASPHGHLWNYPLSNMLTGYVSMDNLQKYSGDLCDFHPLSFRCSNCEAHCLLQKQTRGK